MPLFVASANRALDGEIVAADLSPRDDPLQWVLRLDARAPWTAPIVAHLRQVLRDWAKTNDAEYQRSDYTGRTFTALIIVRGLGPEMVLSPYEEKDVAERARRRFRR